MISDRFREGESVAVLVDLPAVSAALKPSGLDLDFTKLLELAASGRRLHRAIAYGALDPQNPAGREGLAAVRSAGFRVVTKTLRPAFDGSFRAYLGVDMAVELMTAAETCDVLVLVTGDSELLPALHAAQAKGARIEVIGCPAPGVDDLADSADAFVPLGDVQERLTNREGQRDRPAQGIRRPQLRERKEWPTPPPPPPERPSHPPRPPEGRRPAVADGFRVLEGERLSGASRSTGDTPQGTRKPPDEA